MNRAMVGWVAVGAVVVAATLWFGAARRDVRRGEAPPYGSGASIVEAQQTPLAVAEEQQALPDGPDPSRASPTSSRRESAAGPAADELARAHWVEGRVVIPEGTPADERVTVVARGKEFSDGELQRAEVERDGRFRVAFSEKTKTGWLAIEARHLYLEKNPRWTREQPGAEPVVLEPRLGARVAGHLVLPEGVNPSAVGGKLELRKTERRGSSSFQVQHATLDVRALEFEFNGLPIGSTYRVVYEGPALVGSGTELAVEAGETKDVAIELRQGVALAGRVVDDTGAPVAGARVLVTVERSSRTDNRTVECGPEGTFAIGGLAGGTTTIAADHAAFEGEKQELGELETGDVREGLELVLRRGNSVAGRVRWSDGTPAVAELRVGSHGEDPFEFVEHGSIGKSAEDGTFRITGLGAGPFVVKARGKRKEEEAVWSEVLGRETTRKKTVWWQATAEDVAAGTSGLVLVLSPGLVLEGRVVDDLGAPLTSFHVVALRRERAAQGGTVRQDPLTEQFGAPDGRFRMDGFLPGEWELMVQAKDHATVQGVRVAMPADGPVEVALPRAARARGVVLDPAGIAVQGAQIQMLADDLDFSFDLWDEDSSTDERGAFDLSVLRPGRTRLVAEAAGWAPSEPLEVELEPGSVREGLVLYLRAGCRITGEVRGADGAPVPDVDVQVSSWTAGYHESWLTDIDGRFDARGVPAGEIHVSARLPEGYEIEQSVVLETGESTHVVLAASDEAVRLHGRILIGDTPAAGAHVNVNGPGSGSNARSDDSGAYAVMLPGPGSYRVAVYDDGLYANVSVEVPRAPEFRFDLALEVGKISGSVRDEGGRALAEVAIEAHAFEGPSGGGASAVTDEDGVYELQVPAGTYAVTAGGDSWDDEEVQPSYVETSIEGVVVAGNATAHGVDFILRRGAVLEGDVSSMNGEPWTAIWLAPVSGGACRSLTGTDASGHFRAAGVEGGSWLVSASTETRRSAWMRVDLEPGDESEVELELAPATWIVTRVLVDGGATAATVHVVDERGLQHEGYVGDPGGDMAPEDEPRHWSGPFAAGTYRVRAELGGRTAERTVTLSGKDERLDVELEPE